MAPNLLGSSTLFLAETQTESEIGTATPSPTTSNKFSTKPSQPTPKTTTPVQSPSPKPTREEHVIVWRNVLAFVYLHTASVYGLYLALTVAKGSTIWFLMLLGFLGGMGITAGAHRLWAHKTYKAKLPLRIFLMFLQTLAFQNHIYEWVRDHRVHHKFTDTDADPHNSRRGFFFSHIGWLMVKKHRDVYIKGKSVDLSDLEQDPVVVWQRKWYLVMMPFFAFFIPTWIPYYFWNEDPYVAWYSAAILRYTLSLNGTWLVNSAAHIWGTKPYDKSISPTNSVTVAVAAFGEGWHNYHHVFPWDYKAAELGNYRLNFTTGFIDFFAKIGWAYDLKTVPVEMVLKRLRRTGDGSHINAHLNAPGTTESDNNNSDHHHHHDHDGIQIWGWGDQDMEQEDIQDAEIHHPDKTN